jgi:hypothetical protein
MIPYSLWKYNKEQHLHAPTERQSSKMKLLCMYYELLSDLI